MSAYHNLMHANKTSIALALIAVVSAIALLTAGSFSTSILAAKTTKKSTKTIGSLSKFISCVRGLSGTFTRADVDNCYDTVYNAGSGSAVGSSGSVPLTTR
jgi:hypothetical protein